MAADPLEEVLRLVAEGRITADEAAPILAALDEAASAGAAANRAHEASSGPSDGPAARATGAAQDAGSGGGPTTLRVEVSEGGRQVVNLRLPIAIGRYALDRVPGLSGEQVTRVREALNSGMRGPVLVVDDGGSGVRIILE